MGFNLGDFLGLYDELIGGVDEESGDIDFLRGDFIKVFEGEGFVEEG